MKFFLICVLLFSGCSTLEKVHLSSKNTKIKRSWVKRISPRSVLNDNSTSQLFSPIVKENGNIIQASTYGGVFELNRWGLIRWNFKVASGVSGKGALHKNFLFFGTLDKKLKCLDTQTNKIVWSTHLSGSSSVISDFYDGEVFALTEEGELYALNAANGSVLWKVSKPSVKELKVLGGAKPLIFKDVVIAGFPDGTLGAFSLKTGKKKWEKKLTVRQKYSDIDFLGLSPNGSLLVGSFDEALYKIDPNTGRVIWQAFEAPVSDFAFFGSNLFFSAAGGKLVSLKESTGAINFKKEVFSGLGGQPFFFKEQIVVSDSKGPLYIFDKKTAKQISRYDFTFSSGASLSSSNKKDKFYLITNKGYLYSLGVE